MLYVASTAAHLRSFHLPYLRELEQGGWEIHTAGRGGAQPLPGAVRGIELPFEKSMYSPKNFAAAVKLAGILKREHYDVISVHTSLAAFFVRLAVKLAGVGGETAVINTVHGYLFDEDTPWLKRTVLLWAEKLTASSTDLLLTMNRQDTQIAQQYHLSRGAVEQIDGMGVDLDRFRPASATQRREARQRFGLPQDGLVLVYAAEFSKRKNQAMLIRGMGRLSKKTCLLLAGQGALLESCRALAAELGVADRVVFAGQVSDVEACYHASDLCVSSSRSEGLPFHLMEGMHCALPVVASQVKGHEDLVDQGEEGVLYPFDDEDAFAQAVTYLEENESLRRQMGLRASERAERYSLERVLPENLERMGAILQPDVRIPAGAAGK